jgi:hypothetical protein
MLVIASRLVHERDCYAIPSEKLVSAWPEILGGNLMPPCPYQGLREFKEDDGRVLVGPEADIEQLTGQVGHGNLRDDMVREYTEARGIARVHDAYGRISPEDRI